MLDKRFVSFHITVNYNQTDVHILPETGNMVSTMLGEYDLPNDTSGTFKAKCQYCGSSISGSIKLKSFITCIRYYINTINVIMYACYKGF